jgi:hypothetical protein
MGLFVGLMIYCREVAIWIVLSVLMYLLHHMKQAASTLHLNLQLCKLFTSVIAIPNNRNHTCTADV